MSENTPIEWAHHTKNLWWGCTEVSEECEDCYAETQSTWLGFKIWGNDRPRRLLKQNFADVLAWDAAAAKAGEKHRVFWESMGDIMEDRRDLDAPRALAFEAMERTPNLNHLLLTKRPQNFRKLLPLNWLGNPRPNVWGGVTVGLEKSMWRAAELVKLPFAVRFISNEPILGPCDFRTYLDRIHWVISGGKSGRRRPRPVHPDWLSDVQQQCVSAGVPWFFKQWGELGAVTVDDRHGKIEPNERKEIWVHPDGSTARRSEIRDYAWPMVRIGKKAAGALLDGREWREFPEARNA